MDVIFHYRQESSKVGFPFGIGLLIAGILASVMGGMDATESTLFPASMTGSSRNEESSRLPTLQGAIDGRRTEERTDTR